MRRYLPILFIFCASSPAQEMDGVRVGENETRADVVTIGKLQNIQGTQKSQVQISGGTGEARASISSFFRGVKTDFRNVFRMRDPWTCPINIRISGDVANIRPGPTTKLGVRIPADYSIVIDIAVSLHANFDNQEFERRIVEALLLERMMAPHIGTLKMADRDRTIPDWLLLGTTELVRHRGRGRAKSSYANLAQSQEFLSVSNIVQSDASHLKDPSPERDLFLASATALVAALIELDDGNQGSLKLFEFLSELPFHEGEQIGLLRANFPELRGSTGALDKWWALQLAKMGRLSAFEFYTWQDTEKAIREALQLSIPAEQLPEGEEPKKGLSRFLPGSRLAEAWEGQLSDYGDYLDHPNAGAALSDSLNQLEELRLRGFPLYRRVIESYQNIVRLLIEDETRGVKKLLEANEAEFESTSLTMQQVTDVMNHQEATGVDRKSLDFERWRGLRKQLDDAVVPSIGDPFAEYLEDFEKELE